MKRSSNLLSLVLCPFLIATFMTSVAGAVPPPTRNEKKAGAEDGAAKKHVNEKAPDPPPDVEPRGTTPVEEVTKAPGVGIALENGGTSVRHIQTSSADLSKLCADRTFEKNGACVALRKGQRVRAERGRALRNSGTLCSSESTALAGQQDLPLANAHDRVCGRPLGFSKVYVEFVKVAPSTLKATAKTSQPCDVWKAAQAVVPEEQRANVSATLESGCKQSKTVGAPLAAEFLATTVLQGTGDFLKARAKQELVAYAVDQLGSQACRKDGKVRTFLSFTDEPFVFDETCTTAFGASAKGALDYQAFTDGRFQKAFEKELPGAPVALLRAVDRAARTHGGVPIDETQAKVWIEIARGLFSGMLEIQKTGSEPLDVLKRLDVAVTERMKDAKFLPGSETFSCSIGKDKDGKPAPISTACNTLFALRAGSAIKPDGPVQIAATLDAAKNSFCTDYALGAAAANGACVTDDQLDRAAVWLDEAIAVLNDLIDVETARKKLVANGATPLEIAKKIAPDYAKNVERLLRATIVVAKSSGVSESTLDWLTAMSDASAAVGAIIGQDYPAAAANLKAVLALDTFHEVLKNELGTGSLRALNFLLSLGAAKDADSVKLVLEEQAEPLGSYRQKYTDDFVLSLNGFVGPAMGIAHHYSVHNGAAADVAELKPLSALVGLDFSFRARAQHLGFTLTVLDVLGVATVDKKEGGQVDWGGVLVPGVMLRWGIQKSPIVLFASGQWQPLRKSDSATDGVDDWKGAIAAYGGVAVDIPILTLHQN